jgi:hypothetical protein
MNAWHPIGMRRPAEDIVRTWANLEGKSPSTRDDLYRRYREPGALRISFAAMACLSKLVVTLVHARQSIDLT